MTYEIHNVTVNLDIIAPSQEEAEKFIEEVLTKTFDYGCGYKIRQETHVQGAGADDHEVTRLFDWEYYDRSRIFRELVDLNVAHTDLGLQLDDQYGFAEWDPDVNYTPMEATMHRIAEYLGIEWTKIHEDSRRLMSERTEQKRNLIDDIFNDLLGGDDE